MFAHGFDLTTYTLHITKYAVQITQYAVRNTNYTVLRTVLHGFQCSRDVQFRRWGVEEMGSSRDSEFTRQTRSSGNGKIGRWRVQEKKSKIDKEFGRWEVHEIGS